MLIVLAGAGGWVDDAAAGLNEGSVYVAPEVPDAAGLTSAITAEVGDASIGVAVLPENAALEGSGREIILELNRLTDSQYDTIIVAVGDDLSALSVLGGDEAMRIANEAQEADNLEDALTETVQGVLAASDSPPVNQGGGSEGLVIGLAIGAAAIVAAIVGGIAFVRSRRRGSDDDEIPLPDAVRAQVQTLRSLSVEYAKAGAAGHPIAGQTAQDITVIADNVTSLFERLSGKASRDQRRLAEIEYGDKLGKLIVALDRRYLLDILTHPHLWDDPDERISEVRDAVVGVSAQLVENIKQVNAQRALHFQVSLDTLIGGRKELRDWDREFDRAADDRPPPPA